MISLNARLQAGTKVQLTTLAVLPTTAAWSQVCHKRIVETEEAGLGRSDDIIDVIDGDSILNVVMI